MRTFGRTNAGPLRSVRCWRALGLILGFAATIEVGLGQTTKDVVMNRIGLLIGAAKFTLDAGGHTAKPGDYGLDLPTAGGYVSVADAHFLNAATTNDELSLGFWTKKYDIANSSAFWIASPSEAWVFQAHLPWSNNTIYFDTSGCCARTQRLSEEISYFQGYTGDIDWWTNNWHYFVFSKKAGVKQIWIDGLLFIESDDTATPLSTDINLFNIGADKNGFNRVHGVVDDFTVWRTALTEAQITNLVGGALPTALPLGAGLMAWWNFNDAPPPCGITGPAPVCPGSANSYSAPPGEAAYNWSISGSGSIVGSTTGSSVSVAASALCNANFTLVVTVTGNNGVQSTCTNSFAVIDTTPPAVTTAQGADATIECPASPSFTAPTFIDLCQGPITPTFVTVTNGIGCSNVVTRTWTADDGCGNTTNVSQRITVRDTTPPVIQCPSDIVMISCTNVPVQYAVTATDNCSSTVTLVCSPPAGSVFVPGTTNPLHCVATDVCGNSVSCDFMVAKHAPDDFDHPRPDHGRRHAGSGDRVQHRRCGDARRRVDFVQGLVQPNTGSAGQYCVRRRWGESHSQYHADDKSKWQRDDHRHRYRRLRTFSQQQFPVRGQRGE